jgi:hypothetical protein
VLGTGGLPCCLLFSDPALPLAAPQRKYKEEPFVHLLAPGVVPQVRWLAGCCCALLMCLHRACRRQSLYGGGCADSALVAALCLMLRLVC